LTKVGDVGRVRLPGRLEAGKGMREGGGGVDIGDEDEYDPQSTKVPIRNF
jgi:hypothetical protein